MVSTNSQKRAPYQQNKLFDGSEKFVSTFIYQTLFRKINARLDQNDQNFIILTHTLAPKSTDTLSFLETKKSSI